MTPPQEGAPVPVRRERDRRHAAGGCAERRQLRARADRLGRGIDPRQRRLVQLDDDAAGAHPAAHGARGQRAPQPALGPRAPSPASAPRSRMPVSIRLDRHGRGRQLRHVAQPEFARRAPARRSCRCRPRRTDAARPCSRAASSPGRYSPRSSRLVPERIGRVVRPRDRAIQVGLAEEAAVDRVGAVVRIGELAGVEHVERPALARPRSAHARRRLPRHRRRGRVDACPRARPSVAMRDRRQGQAVDPAAHRHRDRPHAGKQRAQCGLSACSTPCAAPLRFPPQPGADAWLRPSRASSASALPVAPPGRSTRFTRTGRPSTCTSQHLALQRAALDQMRAQADRRRLAEAGLDRVFERIRPRQHLDVHRDPRLLAENGRLDDVVHAGQPRAPDPARQRVPRRTGRRPRTRSPPVRDARALPVPPTVNTSTRSTLLIPGQVFVPKPKPVRPTRARSPTPGAVPQMPAGWRRRSASRAHPRCRRRSRRNLPAAASSRAPGPASGHVRS